MKNKLRKCVKKVKTERPKEGQLISRDLKQKYKHTKHAKQNLDIETQSIKAENIKTEIGKTENIN